MERMCIASYFLLDSLTEVSYRRCYINKTNFFFFLCVPGFPVGFLAHNFLKKGFIMRKLPQFRVYKKAGAMQFSLMPAYDNEKEKFRQAKGFVMLEMANSTGQQQKGLPACNWNEKITMKLNDKDLADFLTALKIGKGEIVHDPNAGNGNNSQKNVYKILSIQKGSTSGYFVNMSYQGKTVKSSLDDSEAGRLRLLFMSAIPRIYGW